MFNEMAHVSLLSAPLFFGTTLVLFFKFLFQHVVLLSQNPNPCVGHSPGSYDYMEFVL